MANYPTSLDTLSNPTGGQVQGSTTPTHSGHHTNANDILEALEAKLGIGSSTAAANQVLRGTGAGASAWGQIVSADITDGTIGAVDLAAGAATNVAFASAVSSTTSVHPTWVDLCSMTPTCIGGRVRLDVALVLSCTGALNCYIGYKVDGGAVTQMGIQATVVGSYVASMSLADLGLLSAGPHTITVVWAVTANLVAANAGSMAAVTEFRR